MIEEKLTQDKCYQVAQRIADLYCLYYKGWVCISNPKYSPVPFHAMHSGYNITHLMKHVAGNYAVAIYAGEKATKFVTIDIDDGDSVTVRKVIDTLVEIGLPEDCIYVSLSGKKGYHVDFFFDKVLYNNLARLLYEEMISRSGLDRKKVEFRPTHGQAIKLPLGVHQATQQRCWFVDPVTLKPIESFDYIFEIRAIDHELVDKITGKLNTEYIHKMYAETNKHNTQPSVKTPIKSYETFMLTAPGTRNNMQTKVAAMARSNGCDYDEIVRIQMDWYRAQNKAYINSTEEEVLAEAEKIAKWAINKVDIKEVQNYTPKESAVVIDKKCLPYILGAPTKVTRMVLFLLCIYCAKYGEAKISYRTIAERTGVSAESVKNAVKWLGDHGYIGVEHCISKVNHIAATKSANKYVFPGSAKLCSPRKMYLRNDTYIVQEWPTENNYYSQYIDMLSSMCTIEYLAKFLTKPELSECRKRVEASAESSGDSGDTVCCGAPGSGKCAG